jgi:hypothetical protein
MNRRSEAKSFLKESCIGSIRFSLYHRIFPLKRDQKNLGITATLQVILPLECTRVNNQ